MGRTRYLLFLHFHWSVAILTRRKRQDKTADRQINPLLLYPCFLSLENCSACVCTLVFLRRGNMKESVTRKGGEPLRNFTIALSQDQAEAKAERLSILRSPTRQRIIKLLEKYNDRRLCVFEIAEVLEISHSAGVCPVPDKIDRTLSKKGTDTHGRQTETVRSRVQIQSSARKLAARHDH